MRKIKATKTDKKRWAYCVKVRKLTAIFLLLAGLVNATDYRYVTADASGSGDGTSTTTPWTFSQAVTNATGDMVVYIKEGTYSRGSTSDSPTGDGTAVNALYWIGCDQDWNPIVPSRSSVTGLLNTTDYPNITYTSARFNWNGCSYAVIRCLKVSSESYNGPALITGSSSIIDSCYSTNASTGTSATAITTTSGTILLNCDAALTGASGGLAAISLANNGNIAYGCVVWDSQADGITTNSAYAAQVVSNCLVYGVTGACLNQPSTANWSAPAAYINNTFYGGAYGVKYTTTNQVTAQTALIGNAIFGQSSAPIYSACADGFPTYLRFNAFDNTSFSMGGTWNLLYNSYSNNTITTASPTSVIFRDPANGDFRLRNSSPLIGVSHITYNDIGFCQTGDQPLYSNVYNDSVNGVSGTLTLPSAAQVLYNVLFGPDSGTQGNFYVPAESDVKLGVSFGNDNTEFTGEYVGTGGGVFRRPTRRGGN